MTTCLFCWKFINLIDFKLVYHFILTTKMDWQQVLKERFAVYDIEQALYKCYVGTLSTLRSFAQAICDNIEATEVPFNLRRLYCEAVYGNDPKVRA